MFYEYRNKIYIIGIIILVVASFLYGRSSVNEDSTKLTNNNKNNSTITETPSATIDIENTEITEGHADYDVEVPVKGDDYEYYYSLCNATMGVGRTLRFNIIFNEENVEHVVEIMDESNSPVDFEEIDNETYELVVSNTVRELIIKVVPLTPELVKDKEIENKIDELPFGNTLLNVDLVAQDTISKIKGDFDYGF
jgi:hypothetical protein